MTKHIYIAACAKYGGIYHYTQNKDGSLNEIDFYPVSEPMYLAVKNSKLYVVLRAPFDDNKNSAVITYDILDDGALASTTSPISTLGEVACHIHVEENGDFYCVNYVSGSVFKSPDKLSVHEGSGPNLPRQNKPHTHYINETPDKKYIFATDLGLDTIFTYSKDLCELSRAKVPEGHGVRHLIYSEDGKTVFAANELYSTLSAFDYSDGKLTLVDTASALPDDFCGKSTIAAIRIKNDLIYVSNRGHDSIACFEYKNKKLHLLSITKVGGESPRDFDFVGDYAYSTNEITNSVTVLRSNGDSLELLPFSYSAPNPLAVISIEL